MKFKTVQEMMENKCKKCIREGVDLCETCTLSQEQYAWVDEEIGKEILAAEEAELQKNKEKMANVRAAQSKKDKQLKLGADQIAERMRAKLTQEVQEVLDKTRKSGEQYGVYHTHLDHNYSDQKSPISMTYGALNFESWITNKRSYVLVDHCDGFWTIISNRKTGLKVEHTFITDEQGRAIAPRQVNYTKIKEMRKAALFIAGQSLELTSEVE